MKKSKIELDVDFIGEQGALLPEEEKALGEYFTQRKLTSQKATIKKHRTVKQTKPTV